MATVPPPVIAKWIATRKAGAYLSGMLPIDDEARKLGIKESDVSSFARALLKCPLYTKTIYRGVFKTDMLYNELITKGVATTARFYSFAKTKAWGEAYGNKIVLILNQEDLEKSVPSAHAFGPVWDISKYSRESEVILGKNITLCLEHIETTALFTYIYVKTIS